MRRRSLPSLRSTDCAGSCSLDSCVLGSRDLRLLAHGEGLSPRGRLCETAAEDRYGPLSGEERMYATTQRTFTSGCKSAEEKRAIEAGFDPRIDYEERYT